MELNEITESVIGCAMKVSSALGTGFLEKVYENALAIEMRKAGLSFGQQESVKVLYEGECVGDYVADFVVEGRVLLELKSAKTIDAAHQAQLLNYLRATVMKVGLLLNFGTSRMGIKRMMF